MTYSRINGLIIIIDVGYNIPFRHNHGMPPNRYSPNVKNEKLRYQIANYVSIMR